MPGWIIPVMICLLLSSQPTSAGDFSAELQEVLRQASPNDFIPVVIQFRGHLSLQPQTGENRQRFRRRYVEELQALAARSQAEVRSWLSDHGIRNLKTLWGTNALAARIPSQLIRQLSQRPEIEAVRLDRIITPTGPVLTSPSGH